MKQTTHLLCLLLVLGLGWYLPLTTASAADPDAAREQSTRLATLGQEMRDGFASRISVFGFGLLQQPVDAGLNPENVLEIPRYRTTLEFRPDLFLTLRRLELSVKPRARLSWQRWEDGRRDGDNDTDAEVFVNAWLARLRVTNQLFVSYGRENLQWGPAFLLSPSNPFNPDNGRNNPELEVPGLDYGRVVWIPSSVWTASFIANTDEGRLEPLGKFERTYALKLDYTGRAAYFSIIPSFREDGEFGVGYFAGWTASDALLLYIEGRFAESIDDATVLVGGSYTFAGGPRVVAEFFHQQGGCTLDPVERCFVSSAVSAIDHTDIGTAEPHSTAVLIRQNYLFLQYSHTRVWDTLSLVLRWIHNLDDQSNRIIGIVEYEVGQHMRLFTIANGFTGADTDEFGSLVDYTVMIGAEYVF